MIPYFIYGVCRHLQPDVVIANINKNKKTGSRCQRVRKRAGPVRGRGGARIVHLPRRGQGPHRPRRLLHQGRPRGPRRQQPVRVREPGGGEASADHAQREHGRHGAGGGEDALQPGRHPSHLSHRLRRRQGGGGAGNRLEDFFL